MTREPGTAAPFPPPSSGTGWRAAGSELARRLVQLGERASEVLGRPADLTGHDPRAGLREAAEACAAELAGPHLGSVRCGELATLLSEIQRLADEFSERRMIARARTLAECERGLARLREITTTAGLIDGVCDELVRSLGFERAMLARVESGMWRPWKANVSMFDEAWVGPWIDAAIPLDDLTLETGMLRHRRPALVLDTNQPGIAQIVHSAGVRSYVAAPIMPGGQVVGFFHADHGVLGRTCDEADRDILWTFAEGFGHLYERTALLEQLHARSEQLRATFSGLTQALDELTDAELTLVYDVADSGARTPVVRHGISAKLGQFTGRELEVLELIVAGARNGEIAERLTITVGTVKSHVKNILAKLGVLNRSQAIAMYLGAQREQGLEP